MAQEGAWEAFVGGAVQSEPAFQEGMLRGLLVSRVDAASEFAI